MIVGLKKYHLLKLVRLQTKMRKFQVLVQTIYDFLVSGRASLSRLMIVSLQKKPYLLKLLRLKTQVRRFQVLVQAIYDLDKHYFTFTVQHYIYP